MSTYTLVLVAAFGANPELAPEQVEYLLTLTPGVVRWEYDAFYPAVMPGATAMNVTIGQALATGEAAPVLGSNVQRRKTIRINVVTHGDQQWLLTESEMHMLGMHEPATLVGRRMTRLQRFHAIGFSVFASLVTGMSIAALYFGFRIAKRPDKLILPCKIREEIMLLLKFFLCFGLCMSGITAFMWTGSASPHSHAILIAGGSIFIEAFVLGGLCGLWIKHRNAQRDGSFCETRQIGQTGLYV